MLTDGKIWRGGFMYWLPTGQSPLEEIKPARINKIRLLVYKSFY